MSFLFKKSVLIYLICFYSVSGLLLLGIKLIQKRNYSSENLEKIIMSQSKYRNTVDNLCDFHLFGDPINVGENYVKIEFNCKNGKKIISTMSTVSSIDMRLESILSEYFRIMNFDIKKWEEQKWECFLGERIVNKLEIIGITNTISCFEGINEN